MIAHLRGVLLHLIGRQDPFGGPDAEDSRLHHGTHEGAGGPFAIRPSHMDDRRQPVLRAPKRLERVQDASER